MEVSNLLFSFLLLGSYSHGDSEPWYTGLTAKKVLWNDLIAICFMVIFELYGEGWDFISLSWALRLTLRKENIRLRNLIRHHWIFKSNIPWEKRLPILRFLSVVIGYVAVCQTDNIISSAPRQIGHHFADDVFRCIFMNKKFSILIKISLKFAPRGLINNWDYYR